MPPHRDLKWFKGKCADNESIPLYCSLQNFLCQLIHVAIELLFNGQQFIRNMAVSVARNVNKGYVDRKVVNELAYHTNQINMCLSLLQLHPNIVAV